MIKGNSVNFKGILGNIFKHSDNCKGWLQKLQCSKWSFQFPQLVWILNNFFFKKAGKFLQSLPRKSEDFEIFYIEKAASSKALNVNLQS